MILERMKFTVIEVRVPVSFESPPFMGNLGGFVSHSY